MYLICVILAAISPLFDTSVPDLPSQPIQLSFKNSSQVTSPTSPSLPGFSDEPSENVTLSPDSSTVGEVQEGPIKPKRSAPPPPCSGKLVHEQDNLYSTYLEVK